MYLLGVETSCDETAAAVISLSKGNKILSEIVSSQVALHEAYGGVVPELAAREHLTNLPLVVDEAMRGAGVTFRDLAAIGVTRGPGLKGCLLIGYCYAKGLALAHSLPLIGVNHIEGHILAPLMDDPSVGYPFLSLVVSGGHTEIIHVEQPGTYTLVARTIDDAAGEAFDKSASLLDLPYPGGALLARLADTVNTSRFTLPKVMREQEGFSFSGLKTAISLLLRKQDLSDPEIRAELAHAIQNSIIDALIFKLKRAIEETGVRCVTVTGGVSANRKLREEVSKLKVNAYFPTLAHCTDNAAMIAYAAARRYALGEVTSLDSDVLSRWPVEELS